MIDHIWVLRTLFFDQSHNDILKFDECTPKHLVVLIFVGTCREEASGGSMAIKWVPFNMLLTLLIGCCIMWTWVRRIFLVSAFNAIVGVCCLPYLRISLQSGPHWWYDVSWTAKDENGYQWLDEKVAIKCPVIISDHFAEMYQWFMNWYWYDKQFLQTKICKSGSTNFEMLNYCNLLVVDFTTNYLHVQSTIHH